MRKPSKPKKHAKLRIPEDQIALKTDCEFCREVFPNPSVAAQHLDDEHPGEYKR